MTEHCQLLLLGSAKIIGTDGVSQSLPGRKSLALLAYLADPRNAGVSREEAAQLLWDRSGDAQARASLRQELASLRRSLAKADWEPIAADKDQLTYIAEEDTVDTRLFARLVAQGTTTALKEAIALYQGPFMKGFGIRAEPFEEWLRDSRAHYESLAIGAMGALLDRASEDDRIEAVDVARSMIAVDATQERAHRTIMAASIAEGRPADALRQYERCAEALKRDLDARPSPETERLMQQARSGETVSISTESGSTSIAAEAVIANEAQPSGSDGIAETVPAAVGHAPPAPAKGGQRSRWVIPVAIAAAFVGLPAAAAGAQYWAAGNRIAPDNLLCRMNLIARDDTPVKLAGIMPFDQNHGKRQRWGILRYLRDHRASYPFEVTMDIHDSKGELEETNRILTEMESEKPVAVLGPGQSRIAWDAKKWGNQHQVPMVSSSASAGYLAQPGERDYFFRVGMSDRTRAKSLVDWMQNLGLSQFPYVAHEYAPKTPGTNEPDIYGASQAAVAKDNLGRVTTLRFLRGDKESQLAAIDQIKNDGRPIAMFGYTSNLTFMIMEMQKRGIENPIFLTGVVTAALEQAGFPYPDKLHVVTGIVSEARNLATSARLRRIFEDDNPGLDYDLAAWYSYDATEMVMDAVSRARQETCSGTVDGEAVARQLRLTPTKKREVLSTSFLADTQEIFVESDGLKIIDGKFRHVGLGN